MADWEMETWEKMLQLKDRVAVIKYELARVNNYLQNPFEDKRGTPQTRKEKWEKAARKKVTYEKELKELNATIAKIIAHNQSKIKKTRGKKK